MAHTIRYDVAQGSSNSSNSSAAAVLALSATYKQLQCTGDGKAAVLQLVVHKDSCLPSAYAANTHNTSLNASEAGGTALCSSCMWDVLNSLAIVYCRLADGLAFFATKSEADMHNVSADVVANHSSHAILFPNLDNAADDATEWLAASEDNTTAAVAGALMLANRYRYTMTLNMPQYIGH